MNLQNHLIGALRGAWYRAGAVIAYEPEDEEALEREFAEMLQASRFDDAREQVERLAADPAAPRCLITSMLADLGSELARQGRHDESIAAFERAIELGWEVEPDGRCEIARVLLLAGRHAEADALWAQLRAASPADIWMLNAGGISYSEARRDEEAVEWLADGLRVALSDADSEQLLNQMSDERRAAFGRLGREHDELEREVNVFRARRGDRRDEQTAELDRSERGSAGPGGGSTATVVWLSEAAEHLARERWPGWADGLVIDEPFDDRAARMEMTMRRRRADGDGSLEVVTIDLERYAAWCEEQECDPAHRSSRGTFVTVERDAGAGRPWPPNRNEPCWCGKDRKYKRCCGSPTTRDPGASQP